MPDGHILVIRHFSFGIFSFCRVLDSRCFINRQVKVFRISPFTYLYESHFVQIFETNGHQLLLKSSIGISKVWFTSKRRIRFSSDVRFDVDVIIKGTEAEDAGVTTKGKVTDIGALLFKIKKKRKKFEKKPNRKQKKNRTMLLFPKNHVKITVNPEI